MDVQVRNHIEIEDTYRANRCRSMLNVSPEEGATFERDFRLPLEDAAWRIGAVVGPSGSGKSSVGRELWGGGRLWQPQWPTLPVLDALAPELPVEAVAAVLLQMGLADRGVWLRPYSTLSNGEQFRVQLARLLLEAPAQAVVDEYTSWIDRAMAKAVSESFGPLWRLGGGGQVVVLTCHHDVLEWLEPDWILETSSGGFAWTKGMDHLPEFGKIPVLGKPLGGLTV